LRTGILVFISLILPTLCFGTTYNIGPGETYTTFTLLVASETLSPNDIVDGGDNTFTETWTLTDSGTDGNFITLQNATIDGESTRTNAIYGSNISFIKVQNITFVDTTAAAINIDNGGGGWEIKNNEVSGCGIGFRLEAQNNSVYQNQIHDLVMVVNDATPDNDYGAIGVMISASNNDVYENLIYNCSAASTDYGTDGACLEIYGTADNTQIYRNQCYDSNNFLEVGSASNNSVQDVLILGNLSYHNNKNFLSLHIDGGNAAAISNMMVYNNTIVEDEVDATPTSVSFWFDADPVNGQVVLKNNIIVLNDAADWGNYDPGERDYNLYYLYDVSIDYYNDNDTIDANGVSGNPTFGGGYTLTDGSPGIDAAENLGASYDDIRDPRDLTVVDGANTMVQGEHGVGWEIGAFGFIETTVRGVSVD